MKLRSFNLATIYYSLGSIILFLNFEIIGKQIFSTWLLSILPLTIYLLFNEKFNIKRQIDHVLLSLFSFLSLIINFINLNFSIIPFFLITNSIYIKHTFNKLDFLYKINRIIAILGINFFLISSLIKGQFYQHSPFLFSKNMIILPFVAFMTLFHIRKRRIFDYILYFSSLLIILVSISFGNLIFATFYFICIFLPTESFSSLVKKSFLKLKIRKKFFINILILIISLIIVPFITKPFLNLLNISSDSEELNKVIELLLLFFRNINLYSLRDLIDSLPRFTFFYQYLTSLPTLGFILGNPDAKFFFGTGEAISNPHNSLIMAHMNLGIIGFLLYLHLFIKTIFVFLKRNIRISILALALLIRSMSDIVLILSGAGSFLIFVILFQSLRFENKTEKLI